MPELHRTHREQTHITTEHTESKCTEQVIITEQGIIIGSDTKSRPRIQILGQYWLISQTTSY